MLKMISGCYVPEFQRLCEEYECEKNRIIANVNADKIADIVNNFIVLAKEPLFFILEIPTNKNNEPNPDKALHNDVYYIDGCSSEKALHIFKDNQELLINDGMLSFGFGSHCNGDEIMACPYNIVTVFSQNPESYTNMFDNYSIPRHDKVLTAWDTFTQSSPGTCSIYSVNGKDIYSLPTILKENGIYLAERREI